MSWQVEFHHGVRLPQLGWWLDAHAPQPRCFVSHAHSDHIAPHGEILCSPGTARLLRARLPGRRTEHILPFGHTEALLPGCAVTLHPAGHIHGSAQILLAHDDHGSLLYTGDFKLRPGRSAEPCATPPADTLIMETTFGLPHYAFPPTDSVLRDIAGFCHDCLDAGETPVLFGYSLGKSQELLCGLAAARLPVMLHPQTLRLTRIYEELGQAFPPYREFNDAEAAGHVVICPPQSAASAFLRRLPRRRTAVVTGWALDPGAVHRYQCDAAFPLSDHADFPDLLRFVELVRPRRVLTLHGFAREFALTLRERGIEAWALGSDNQLEFRLATRAASAPPPSPAAAGTPASAPAAPLATPDAFFRFCAVAEAVKAAPRRLDKIAALQRYLAALDPAAAALAAVFFTARPFPQADGRTLGLGWALLRPVLLELAGLSEADYRAGYRRFPDAGDATEALLHARAPSPGAHPPQSGAQPHAASAPRPDAGEFSPGGSIFPLSHPGSPSHPSDRTVPTSAAPAPSPVSLPDLAAAFTAVAAARGPAEKQDRLRPLLLRLAPVEAKYLVKLVGGDLRIGLKDGLVEEALAAAADVPLELLREAHLLSGDLGAVARAALAPADADARRAALAAIRLRLFHPVQFMLASPEPTADAVLARLAPPVWLEEKYDGIRCQLHKQGARIELFSRDLHRLTSQFPDLVAAALFLPDDAVLDGELLAWRDGRALPFAELQKRLGRKGDDFFLGREIPVSFVGYDLLWQDGTELLRRPLSERRERLAALFARLPSGPAGRLSLAPVVPARTAAEIEAAFLAARRRGNEGLMAKDPSSPYTPGRRGLAWLKLKKAYATLDVVVVAAEYGHGRRRDVLSDYTFAVRDDAGDGRLLAVGKAYSGLTDAEIARLTAHFLAHTLEVHGRRHVVVPDTVLEVAFDSIQPSPRHAGGFALRFPRIVRIRTDKTPADIDTLATCRRLAAAVFDPPPA